MPVPRARVCLTFDFDALSPWVVTRRDQVPPSVASRGEYGALVGAPRVLDLLDRYGIKATWFVPGHTIDTFPAPVQRVADAGHEVAHHGYCHESPTRLSPEAERTVLEMVIACVKRVTGRAPTGYRAPAGDFSARTMPLLLEYGFSYDSSLSATDFSPYWARIGDKAHDRKAYEFGDEVPIAEIPMAWNRDDWSYLEYAPGFSTGGRTPSHVLQAWRGEFDFMYEEVPGGVFTLTMHPQVIGRGPRVLMLEQLIQHVRRRPGSEFRLMSEVDAEFRAETRAPAKTGGAR